MKTKLVSEKEEDYTNCEHDCEDCCVNVANSLESPVKTYLARMSLLIRDINTFLETPARFDADIYRFSVSELEGEAWVSKLKMLRPGSKKDIMTLYVNKDKEVEYIIHRGQTKNVSKSIEYHQKMIQTLPEECKITILKSVFSPEYNAPKNYKEIAEAISSVKKPSKVIHFNEEGEIIQGADIEDFMVGFLDKAMDKMVVKITKTFNDRMDKIENDIKSVSKSCNMIISNTSTPMELMGLRNTLNNILGELKEIPKQTNALLSNNTFLSQEIKSIHADIFKVKNDCDDRISSMTGSVQALTNNHINSLDKITAHITKESNRIIENVSIKEQYEPPYSLTPEGIITPIKPPMTKKCIWGASVERAMAMAQKKAGDNNDR